MKSDLNRRHFLKNTAIAGAAVWMAGSGKSGQCRSPNEKLNVGIVGSAHRGGANLKGVSGENIVALCDVHEGYLEQAAKEHPKAKKYVDWRKLLDQKDIDAVVVSTTDHTHTPISVRAMRAGKHVYCEKPLGLSVQEARLMRETSRQCKVATQQGTQVHVTENFHRVAELIQGGAIGPVREARVWCTRQGAGGGRPQGDFPVPAELHWDLWLGPAPQRPYHPSYVPGCGKWNKFWDFGGGTLGDMGSHLIDFPFSALGLKHPMTVEAEGTPVNPETCPEWLIVRWEHPAVSDRPPVKVVWYDGIKRPEAPRGVNLDDWHGILFVGEKGTLWANYGGYALIPLDDSKEFVPPKPTVPWGQATQGHYDEWIRACKTGSPTACNFQYAGLLIEHNMLGNVAYRLGRKITWDAQNMKAVDCPEADQYIYRSYREGWELPG